MGNFGVFGLAGLLVLALISLVGVNGTSIDDTGGYTVLVAVNEDTLEPWNVAQYIQNLKRSLQIFSTELARATEGVFYVKNCDFLLPKSWIVPGALPATTQSIGLSDIILSHGGVTPYVDNPNACGLPGKQILLPNDFFDEPGRYGPNWKALLTMWARLRWGVWEEHGYPGDSIFPYFYLTDNPDVWEETACANEKLLGKYVDTNGDDCSIGGPYLPDASCRFLPIPGNTATSSLMSFHFIESVTHFCTNSSHNTKAPTRQNYFCYYRSVWDVIRGTLDYAVATSGPPLDDIPLTKFTILQHLSPSRALYVLLDRGALNAHAEPILTSILPEIQKLIETLSSDVIIALGEYPGDRHDALRQLVPWNTLEANRQQILSELSDWPDDGPQDRHFSKALHLAVRLLEESAFPQGSALLVVKTGTYDANDFVYEQEIYQGLVRNFIQLYAAEVTNPNVADSMPPSLRDLTLRTGGGYGNLNDSSNSPTAFSTLAEEILEEISFLANLTLPRVILVHKRIFGANEFLTVDLRKRSTVTVRLTIEKAAEALLTLAEVNSPIVYYSDEWAYEGDHLRQTLTYVHEFDETEPALLVGYVCQVQGCDAYTGLLVVTEKMQETQYHETTSVRVTVRTSAEPYGDALDFAADETPFVIYAQVELDMKPVRNAVVIATVTIDRETFQIRLMDDGLGHPDVQRLDGIYSGTFVPARDTSSASVTVQVTSDLSNSNSIPDHGQARLLPVDQGEIGCTDEHCGSVALTQDVSIMAELSSTLTFTNVHQYPGLNLPERITDFVAEKSMSIADSINFRWTVPNVLGSDTAAVGNFTLYGAVTQEQLIGSPEEGEVVGQITEGIQESGQIQRFTSVLPNSSFLYFAIQSFTADSTEPSELSMVARLTAEPLPDDPLPSTSVKPTTTLKPDETFFETPVGIVLIVFLSFLVFCIFAGGGYWMYRKRHGRDSNAAQKNL